MNMLQAGRRARVEGRRNVALLIVKMCPVACPELIGQNQVTEQTLASCKGVGKRIFLSGANCSHILWDKEMRRMGT